MSQDDTSTTGDYDRTAHTLDRALGEDESFPHVGFVIDGCYRVLRHIGAGGMGTVVLARDERLQREVAVKLIRADMASGYRARTRFVDEARAMARVRHPNVIDIYAFGELKSGPYFVMEYVRGSDLETLVAARGSPLPLGEAHAILDQICRGLDAIHRSGTVHRDVKPSNVMIGDGLRAAIGDLGLAGLLRDTGTEGGAIRGTPGYMAPELIAGRHIPASALPLTDVYALGVLAYELLAGRLPFESDATAPLLGMHLAVEPTPLREHRRDLPVGYETAVLSALAKDPDRRMPSVEAFRSALEAASQGRPTSSALHLLVVDDDPGFRSLIAQTLAKAFPWASVAVAADGEAALQAAHCRPPSLVVSDLNMPRMNGIELSEALRADPRTAQAPIVVTTGVGGPAEWRTLSEIGVDSFLLKPFDPAHLVSLAENALSVQAAWRPRRARRR